MTNLDNRMPLSRQLSLLIGAVLAGLIAVAGSLDSRAQESSGNQDKPAIRRPSEAPAPLIPEPKASLLNPNAESNANSAEFPPSGTTVVSPDSNPADTPPQSGTEEGELDPEAEAKAASAARMNQLVPIGRVFRGVKIPNYSGDALGSVVHADFMRRADEEHLEMEMLEIVNYNRGEPDSRILTDRAIYDLEAKTLRSTTPARIVQEQFEMSGDRMIFDSITRIGHFSGRVKTRIYQVDQYSSDQ